MECKSVYFFASKSFLLLCTYIVLIKTITTTGNALLHVVYLMKIGQMFLHVFFNMHFDNTTAYSSNPKSQTVSYGFGVGVHVSECARKT